MFVTQDHSKDSCELWSSAVVGSCDQVHDVKCHHMLLSLLQGLLEAHKSVAGHTLADLPACSSSAAAAELPTLLLIDTAGCDFDEQQGEDGDSRCGQTMLGLAGVPVNCMVACAHGPTQHSGMSAVASSGCTSPVKCGSRHCYQRCIYGV
jgi:hypothetical protein